MKLLQFTWTKAQGWTGDRMDSIYPEHQLVLAFGSREQLVDPARMDEIKDMFPNAEVLATSSAGEISGSQVLEDSISITAIQLEKSSIRSHSVTLSDTLSRREAAIEVSKALADEGLRLIFVLADGQNVNGSELVSGFNTVFKGNVPVVGGLAGDGSKFEETLVGLNSAPIPGQVAAIGFYGDSLKIGFGSRGGWLPFGPERLVTKSYKNVLYELDGKSALGLYKSYLGERANELPASALLFPLSIKSPGSPFSTVRTILSVDDEANSMTFAGDIPVGSTVQLMKAGFERLIEGANEAVDECLESGAENPELAILVSCVGRRLIMGPRVDEEVELIQERFKDATICGFYSYGELSPALPNGYCELHNQTMTVTTISEI